MNFEQTTELCKRVALVEGRTYTAELAKSWHDLLKGLGPEVANRACSLALQDVNIHSVGPKHILAKKDLAVGELNAALQVEVAGEAGWKSEPPPVCREHGLPITKCNDCVLRLMREAYHLRGDRLHMWAIEHLYDPASLV